jgi:hypothetical protein
VSDRERWRYVHILTIYQIALLMEGYNPSEFGGVSHYNWQPKVREEIAAISTALRNAIDDESLSLHRKVYHDGFGGDIDYELSLVHVDDLQDWMRRINLHDSFFRPAKQAPDIEYPLGDFYAPKLAAAIAAWKAVTADPRLLRGKSPKKALEAWLRENAARYDLLNKDGSPNATGIEEIAKVANWKRTGGAPATPESDEPSLGFGKTSGGGFKKTTGGFDLALDEEIPF